MDNSKEKKKDITKHRRIKTDFSIFSDNNNLASAVATPLSLRYKT